jgi:hypothetical protein
MRSDTVACFRMAVSLAACLATAPQAGAKTYDHSRRGALNVGTWQRKLIRTPVAVNNVRRHLNRLHSLP